MPVQQSPRRDQNSFRNPGKYSFGDLDPPCATLGVRRSEARVSPIRQHRPDGTQAMLELNQAFMIQLGTTEIKFPHPLILGLLNRFPKQKGYTTEIVKPLV